MNDLPTRLAEPVAHVIRPPLPWRGEDLTECGKPVHGNKTITIDELRARLNNLGKQRTLFITCMTCCKTLTRTRIQKWADDPVSVLRREIERGRHEELRRELTAITMLIDANRAEFDELLAGLADTPNLAARRAQRARQQREGGSIHHA